LTPPVFYFSETERPNTFLSPFPLKPLLYLLNGGCGAFQAEFPPPSFFPPSTDFSLSSNRRDFYSRTPIRCWAGCTTPPVYFSSVRSFIPASNRFTLKSPVVTWYPKIPSVANINSASPRILRWPFLLLFLFFVWRSQCPPHLHAVFKDVCNRASRNFFYHWEASELCCSSPLRTSGMNPFFFGLCLSPTTPHSPSISVFPAPLQPKYGLFAFRHPIPPKLFYLSISSGLRGNAPHPPT